MIVNCIFVWYNSNRKGIAKSEAAGLAVNDSKPKTGIIWRVHYD